MATIRPLAPVEGIETTTNLASPPRAVDGSPDINPYQHVAAATGTGGVVTTEVVSSPSTPGRDVFRVRWTTSPTAIGTADLVRRATIPVTPGKWYGYLVSALTAGLTRTLVTGLVYIDGGGAGLGQVSGTPAAVGGTEVWLSVVAQAPAGAATMRPDLDLDGASPTPWPVGSGYDLRGSLIVEGDTQAEVQAAIAGGYFDGSTPGAHWNGTPHTSTSSLDYVIAPALVLDYGHSRGSRNVVLERLGSGYPTVFLRDAQSKAGTLRLLFNGAAPARTAGDVLSSTNHFQFEEPAVGEDFHFVVTGPVSVTKVEGVSYWTVDAEFREVEPL